MRKANVYMHDQLAGHLIEEKKGQEYIFMYTEIYKGPPISLSMPIMERQFKYHKFPPFFDGILPEGTQLEGLLKIKKIDRQDFFSQLIAVGQDLVGAVTVEESSK